MTGSGEIDRLRRIAQLKLDVQLAKVSAADRARQESLDRLRGLDATPVTDLDPVAAARTELLYQLWADARRVEIDATLTRQTIEWLARVTNAREAFGKAEALRQLAEKARKR